MRLRTAQRVICHSISRWLMIRQVGSLYPTTPEVCWSVDMQFTMSCMAQCCAILFCSSLILALLHFKNHSTAALNGFPGRTAAACLPMDVCLPDRTKCGIICMKLWNYYKVTYSVLGNNQSTSRFTPMSYCGGSCGRAGASGGFW